MTPNVHNVFFFVFGVNQLHRKSDVKTTWDDLLWRNIIYLAYLHLGGVYGLYLLFTGQCKIATVLMSKCPSFTFPPNFYTKITLKFRSIELLFSFLI